LPTVDAIAAVFFNEISVRYKTNPFNVRPSLRQNFCFSNAFSVGWSCCSGDGFA